MIGYITLGTRDLQRGAKFYDAIFKEMGIGRMMENDTFIGWGEPGGATGLSITYPWDKQPATVGNGTMVALEVKDKAQVDRIYKIAMAEGGTDEGPPGERFEGFYAAYFRDLDGNKLNAYVMG